MLEVVYCVSLVIIIASAAVVAFHNAIPGGFIGATFLGGVAVFAIAGFESSPPIWLIGFMASLAGSCVWAATRWQMMRNRLLRRMKGDRC